jgi:hypothetical protein
MDPNTQPNNIASVAPPFSLLDGKSDEASGLLSLSFPASQCPDAAGHLRLMVRSLWSLDAPLIAF